MERQVLLTLIILLLKEQSDLSLLDQAYLSKLLGSIRLVNFILYPQLGQQVPSSVYCKVKPV